MKVVALAALAACSFPEKHAPGDGNKQPDSGPADAATAYGCLGRPFATTANDPVTLGGSVFQINADFTRTVLSNASVVGDLTSGGTQIFSTTSDGNGVFNASVQTNGTAPDAYVLANGPPGSGLSQTTYHPSRPFNNSEMFTLLLTSPATMMQLYGVFGFTYDATRGTVAVQVVDCTGAPVSGARIILNNGSANAGTIVYEDSAGTPNMTLGMTTSSGGAVVANQPTSTTITATAAAGNFHTYSYTITANALTQITIQP